MIPGEMLKWALAIFLSVGFLCIAAGIVAFTIYVIKDGFKQNK